MAVRLDPFQNIVNVHWHAKMPCYMVLNASFERPIPESDGVSSLGGAFEPPGQDIDPSMIYFPGPRNYPVLFRLFPSLVPPDPAYVVRGFYNATGKRVMFDRFDETLIEISHPSFPTTRSVNGDFVGLTTSDMAGQTNPAAGPVEGWVPPAGAALDLPGELGVIDNLYAGAFNEEHVSWHAGPAELGLWLQKVESLDYDSYRPFGPGSNFPVKTFPVSPGAGLASKSLAASMDVMPTAVSYDGKPWQIMGSKVYFLSDPARMTLTVLCYRNTSNDH